MRRLIDKTEYVTGAGFQQCPLGYASHAPCAGKVSLGDPFFAHGARNDKALLEGEQGQSWRSRNSHKDETDEEGKCP